MMLLKTVILLFLFKFSNQNELSHEMDRILHKIEAQMLISESKLIDELKLYNYINIVYAVISIFGIIYGVSVYVLVRMKA